MSELPHFQVVVRPGLVEELEAAANMASITVPTFLAQVIESELAARRVRRLPPPRVPETSERVQRPSRADVHPDDLSGPVIRYSLRF